MANFVIVPNYVSDTIDAELHRAFLQHPDPFWPSSETWHELHRQLLVYFNEHGVIPYVSVYRKAEEVTHG